MNSSSVATTTVDLSLASAAPNNNEIFDLFEMPGQNLFLPPSDFADLCSFDDGNHWNSTSSSAPTLLDSAGVSSLSSLSSSSSAASLFSSTLSLSHSLSRSLVLPSSPSLASLSSSTSSSSLLLSHNSSPMASLKSPVGKANVEGDSQLSKQAIIQADQTINQAGGGGGDGRCYNGDVNCNNRSNGGNNNRSNNNVGDDADDDSICIGDNGNNNANDRDQVRHGIAAYRSPSRECSSLTQQQQQQQCAMPAMSNPNPAVLRRFMQDSFDRHSSPQFQSSSPPSAYASRQFHYPRELSTPTTLSAGRLDGGSFAQQQHRDFAPHHQMTHLTTSHGGGGNTSNGISGSGHVHRYPASFGEGSGPIVDCIGPYTGAAVLVPVTEASAAEGDGRTFYDDRDVAAAAVSSSSSSYQQDASKDDLAAAANSSARSRFGGPPPIMSAASATFGMPSSYDHGRGGFAPTTAMAALTATTAMMSRSPMIVKVEPVGYQSKPSKKGTRANRSNANNAGASSADPAQKRSVVVLSYISQMKSASKPGVVIRTSIAKKQNNASSTKHSKWPSRPVQVCINGCVRLARVSAKQVTRLMMAPMKPITIAVPTTMAMMSNSEEVSK